MADTPLSMAALAASVDALPELAPISVSALPDVTPDTGDPEDDIDIRLTALASSISDAFGASGPQAESITTLLNEQRAAYEQMRAVLLQMTAPWKG